MMLYKTVNVSFHQNNWIQFTTNKLDFSRCNPFRLDLISRSGKKKVEKNIQFEISEPAF